MSSKEFDLGWLVGILEGEGSLSLTKGKDGRCQCHITFYNTDINIIDKVEKCLEDVKVSFWRRSVRVRKNHLGKRPVYELRISHTSDINYLLKMIYKNLVSYKRIQSELMIKYTNRRLLLMKRYKQGQQRRYNEEDYVLTTEFKNARNN